MSTINRNNINPSNQKLVDLINDLANVLYNYNHVLYTEFCSSIDFYSLETKLDSEQQNQLNNIYNELLIYIQKII